jgi:hypothetical protein
MRSELMVFNSCGHVTLEVVSDEVFNNFTRVPGHGPLGEVPPCRFRVGKTRRRAYVYPARYSSCYECFKTSCLDDL